MFTRKEYLIILAILILPLIPSVFLSKNIVLKSLEDPSDPFRIEVSGINLDDVLWLDARTRVKYEIKHIPGAVLVNAKEWEASLARLFEVFEPGQTMIVYCNKGCSSSRTVAARLRQELGQDNIFYLHGGMDSWFKNTSH